MNRRLILTILAFMVTNDVLADTSLMPQPMDGRLCRQAIATAERAHGIPMHLLAAIARVESGRRDPTSGTVNPWPWTINFDGQGSYYDSKAQAVANALTLRARAVRSIDVGCMQISLTYHPDAFNGMDQAFDPQSNADYGARFLVQLYEKTASWPKAVELYHSATPDLGSDYQQKVYAVWPEEKKLAEVSNPLLLINTLTPLVHRPVFSSLFGQSTPRIIQRLPAIGRELPPGRTLDAYRSAPVRLAFRAP